MVSLSLWLKFKELSKLLIPSCNSLLSVFPVSLLSYSQFSLWEYLSHLSTFLLFDIVSEREPDYRFDNSLVMITYQKSEETNNEITLCVIVEHIGSVPIRENSSILMSNRCNLTWMEISLNSIIVIIIRLCLLRVRILLRNVVIGVIHTCEGVGVLELEEGTT